MSAVAAIGHLHHYRGANWRIVRDEGKGRVLLSREQDGFLREAELSELSDVPGALDPTGTNLTTPRLGRPPRLTFQEPPKKQTRILKRPYREQPQPPAATLILAYLGEFGVTNSTTMRADLHLSAQQFYKGTHWLLARGMVENLGFPKGESATRGQQFSHRWKLLD